MAIQTINTGASDDDPSAETARSAFTKVNSGFGTLAVDLGYDRSTVHFAETETTGEHRAYTSVTVTSGTEYVVEIEARQQAGRRIVVWSNTNLAGLDTIIDLDAGTAAPGSTGSGQTIVTEDLGAGYVRATITRTAPASGSTNLQIRLVPLDSVTYSRAGDTSTGVYVRSVRFRAASAEAGTSVVSTSVASGWTLQGGTATVATPAYPTTAAVVTSINRQFEPHPWAGTDIACLGSSITAQGKYTIPLGVRIGATITNLGSGGGSLGTSSLDPVHYGSEAIYNQIASISSSADGVILESGINDFGAGVVPLGTLGDTTVATYYGALYAAVTAIMTQAPNAVVFLTTPHSADSRFADNNSLTARSDGARLRQFQQAVDDVSRWLGCPLIDYGRQAGINYWSATDYTSDGLHPNDAGGTVIANFMAAEMRRTPPRP